MLALFRKAAWALAACTAIHTAAAAAEWAPTKPVRIIVPIVGSTNDVLGRLVASKLEGIFGQPVIVENKPGAGGNIGADLVAKSPPDGYTLLVGYNGPIAINKTLFDNMPYDPVTDLAPITLAVSSPQYLVVNPNMPVKTVTDLVAWSKANPGKLSYGSVATGSASHLTMEMLNEAAGLGATHVPYRGASPALVDLVAGNVQAAFLVPGNVQQYVKEGRLKLLASTGEKRFPSTPDVPTMIESGYPGFVATSWIGFLAPAGTPREIIDRYNKEIVKVLHMPDVQQKLRDMEFEVVGNTPEQFGAWIRTEVERWGKVIKSTGAKAG
ncbi:MAG: tripartite tricarboxylate transporter substrate binding protein [Pigmentiphaga sp.]|uniref:Bug family tripartite tricarboxylate transporter substrate binding protein n=1 Tax=Pigmentiphaga sp. TaxID=1977564 RepID=UPI0029B0AB46|nr:tripartite tricarboxylate transporter substrate binding protein [Pigmentiphaga sp.]MDX3904808.1 tripartite tricarboxylate transporter substrate binding protein [Pigmentiphaga sp.]